MAVSSVSAAVIVIVLFLGITLPIFYWMFYKMDTPNVTKAPAEIIRPRMLAEHEIEQIQSELEVKLPTDYVDVLTKSRAEILDSTTLLDDANSIIEATNEYRRGFEGLPKWPKEYVYIGDEADACPYVIDCKTGQVIRTDKGNINRKPLQNYSSINEFILECERSLT